MGIVNVTPDSFSDGGNFLDPAAAIAHATQLVADGADLIDIGGESTRPDSKPVSEQEELDRVLPVVEAVCRPVSVPVSIDTSKAAVAQAAVEVGAEIINDVTALGGDPQMLDVARRSGAGICIMHMQGTPPTMQEHPHYQNVVREVFGFLQNRRDELIAAGIDPHRICIDPGIGFGKTPQHNIELLEKLLAIARTAMPGARRTLAQRLSRPNSIGCVVGPHGGDSRRVVRTGPARRSNPSRPRRGGGPPGTGCVRSVQFDSGTPSECVAGNGWAAGQRSDVDSDADLSDTSRSKMG